MFKRAVAALAVVPVAVLAGFAQPAVGSHAGSIVDCGSAGTFTLKAQETGTPIQRPDPAVVTVFEEGGALAILSFSINGELIFTVAETGQANNNIDEVSCSYTTGLGTFIEVTGILSTP
jgi:hypothetical protein